MGLGVDIIAEGVLDELWLWADRRARETGVTVADVVNRALESERRRVERLPRLDPRTRTPGRRGAGGQVAPNEWRRAEMIAGVSRDYRYAPNALVDALVDAQVIATVRPTSQGVPAAYADVDRCLLAVADSLQCGPSDAAGLAPVSQALRTVWPRTRDLFVLAHDDGRIVLCSTSGLPDQLHTSQRCDVVNIGRLWQAVARPVVAA